MNRMLIPPSEPKPPEPVRAPMVYVEKPVKWEYKQIARDLEKEQPLNEAELNALGEEGWELSGIAQQPPMTHYYLKRQTEN
jgi:hypothetical protein